MGSYEKQCTTTKVPKCKIEHKDECKKELTKVCKQVPIVPYAYHPKKLKVIGKRSDGLEYDSIEGEISKKLANLGEHINKAGGSIMKKENERDTEAENDEMELLDEQITQNLSELSEQIEKAGGTVIGNDHEMLDKSGLDIEGRLNSQDLLEDEEDLAAVDDEDLDLVDDIESDLSLLHDTEVLDLLDRQVSQKFGDLEQLGKFKKDKYKRDIHKILKDKVIQKVDKLADKVLKKQSLKKKD